MKALRRLHQEHLKQLRNSSVNFVCVIRILHFTLTRPSVDLSITHPLKSCIDVYEDLLGHPTLPKLSQETRVQHHRAFGPHVRRM